MKFTLKKKLTSLLVATLSTLVLIGTASAIGEGQIEGGEIYRIKNVSNSTGFANTQTADACDTVQYKVRLHNPGPGIVNSVNVKVNLPTGASTTNTSTVTITGQNMQPSTTTASATLNISTAQEVRYVSGSTQLLDTLSNPLSTLPDGITGGGVNIGNVGVSLNEIRFVQFQAKINCPEKPTPTPVPPKEDSPQPEVLPDTGPGDVAAVIAAVTVGSSTIYYMIVRRYDLIALLERRF